MTYSAVASAAPSVRAGLLHDVLRAVRELCPRAVTAVDEAAPAPLRTYAERVWVPLHHSVAIDDAIERVAGLDMVAAVRRRATCITMDGPLLAALVVTARLAGHGARKLFRYAPAGWRMTNLDVGDLRLEGDDGDTLLELTNVPAHALASLAWCTGLRGAFEGTLAALGAPDARVELTRGASALRFETRWDAGIADAT